MGMLLSRHYTAETGALERPAGNASKAEWAAYAIQEGHDATEVEALKRDELAALFAEPASAGQTADETGSVPDGADDAESTPDGAGQSSDESTPPVE